MSGFRTTNEEVVGMSNALCSSHDLLYLVSNGRTLTLDWRRPQTRTDRSGTSMGQRLSTLDCLVDADSSGVLLLPQEDRRSHHFVFHRFFHPGSEWGVVKLPSLPSFPWPLPSCWDELHDMCEAAHKSHTLYLALSRNSEGRSRSSRFVPVVQACFKSKAEAFETLYLSRLEKAAFFRDSVSSTR